MKPNELSPTVDISNDINEFAPIILGSADYARLRELAASDELTEELDRAIVVPMEQIPDNVVTMHSCCCYMDSLSGTSRQVELVYPDEADAAAGRISVLSPVGSALLGLRVGQKIAWDFPDGSRRSLRVEKVSRSAC